MGLGDMRNRVAAWALALICLLAAGAARAEAVWVREDWQQLTGEYDCGGVRLSVDARAMILPAGATVPSYRAPTLRRARPIALRHAIHWPPPALDPAQGPWPNPTPRSPEHALFSRRWSPYSASAAPRLGAIAERAFFLALPERTPEGPFSSLPAFKDRVKGGD